MTANEVRIRQLFNQGYTTTESIKPLVSCCQKTIQRTLKKIADELAECSSLSFNKIQAELVLKKHLSVLEGDLEVLEQAMNERDAGGLEWLKYLDHKIKLINEIEKRSGSALFLKVVEKVAIKKALEDDDSSAVVSRNSPILSPSGRRLR